MEHNEHVVTRYQRLVTSQSIRQLSMKQVIGYAALSRFETDHYHLDKTYLIDLFRSLHMDYEQYMCIDASFLDRLDKAVETALLTGKIDQLPKADWHHVHCYTTELLVVEMWQLAIELRFHARYHLLKDALKYARLDGIYALLKMQCQILENMYLDQYTMTKDALQNYNNSCKKLNLPSTWWHMGHACQQALIHHFQIHDQSNDFLKDTEPLTENELASQLLELYTHSISDHPYTLPYLSHYVLHDVRAWEAYYQEDYANAYHHFLEAGKGENESAACFWAAWSAYKTGEDKDSLTSLLKRISSDHPGYEHLSKWLRECINVTYLEKAQNDFRENPIMLSIIRKFMVYTFVKEEAIEKALAEELSQFNEQVFSKKDLSLLANQEEFL